MLLKVWFKYLQIYSFWEVNVNLLVHVFDVWGWVFFRSSFWVAGCCLGKQWRSWYPFCWKYLSVNYRNSVERTEGEMSRHVLCIQVKFLRKNETDSICLTGAVSWRNVYSNCCKHKGVFPHIQPASVGCEPLEIFRRLPAKTKNNWLYWITNW